MDDGMNQSAHHNQAPTYGGSRFRMEFEQREERKKASAGKVEKLLVTLGFAVAVLLITSVLVAAGTSL